MAEQEPKGKFTFSEVLRKFLKGKDLSKVPSDAIIPTLTRPNPEELDDICDEISTNLLPQDKELLAKDIYDYFDK
ncbi:MAG: hypothetical protein ABIJ05_01020 [Patescibacteria group bacterium]